MLHSIVKIFRQIQWILFFTIFSIQAHQKVCIIIPAYNEEQRIQNTLQAYIKYFSEKPEHTTFLVVANNCSDHTAQIVENIAEHNKHVALLDLKPGGKGFAVKQGFLWALDKNFDLIGFVDADMATLPQYFYDLILACKNNDGAIASRYLKGAVIEPSRPWGRVIGGKIYNWMLRSMLGLPYKDTQCGAKVFTKDTIEKIAPAMEEIGWSFDLELLYLCKLYDKHVAEIPTTWSDQPGSHLVVSSKVIQEFLGSPKRIKQRHAKLKNQLRKERQIARKKKSKKSRKNKH